MEADFSHVRSLHLSGARLLAQQASDLFRSFPNVQYLELYVRPNNLGQVAERLASVPGITRLSLTGPLLTYSPEVLLALNRMTALERLSLAGNLETLDIQGLTALRRLTVSGTLETWPQGLLALEHLEFLDLAQTQLRSVPAEMLVGHQRLWRGLQMNWAAYEPEDFMRVLSTCMTIRPIWSMSSDWCRPTAKGPWLACDARTRHSPKGCCSASERRG